MYVWMDVHVCVCVCAFLSAALASSYRSVSVVALSSKSESGREKDWTLNLGTRGLSHYWLCPRASSGTHSLFPNRKRKREEDATHPLCHFNAHKCVSPKGSRSGMDEFGTMTVLGLAS